MDIHITYLQDGFSSSVVGYMSNMHPDCNVWQSGYFEEGSHVVLGKTYRNAKIIGSYGVGKNYVMMKLEEVGRFPEDQMAIQRMVVLTCPSSLSHQLSFCQCLLWFFWKHFIGTFRDFADDDDFEKDMKSVKSSYHSLNSSSSDSELFDEVDLSSEEMGENGSQFNVSDLFLDFIVILLSLFSSVSLIICFFIPCSPLAISLPHLFYLELVCNYYLYKQYLWCCIRRISVHKCFVTRVSSLSFSTMKPFHGMTACEAFHDLPNWSTTPSSLLYYLGIHIQWICDQ